MGGPPQCLESEQMRTKDLVLWSPLAAEIMVREDHQRAQPCLVNGLHNSTYNTVYYYVAWVWLWSMEKRTHCLLALSRIFRLPLAVIMHLDLFCQRQRPEYSERHTPITVAGGPKY